MLFSGGPEVTPQVEVVPSNYYRAEPGDALLHIQRPVSLETLRRILAWASGEQASRSPGPSEPSTEQPDLSLMDQL
jgi:hypothetical protein